MMFSAVCPVLLPPCLDSTVLVELLGEETVQNSKSAPHGNIVVNKHHDLFPT